METELWCRPDVVAGADTLATHELAHTSATQKLKRMEHYPDTDPIPYEEYVTTVLSLAARRIDTNPNARSRQVEQTLTSFLGSPQFSGAYRAGYDMNPTDRDGNLHREASNERDKIKVLFEKYGIN
ncbi:MAG: hypothetical protein ACOCXQ_00005 [Patescibacteria group bacterium]